MICATNSLARARSSFSRRSSANRNPASTKARLDDIVELVAPFLTSAEQAMELAGAIARFAEQAVLDDREARPTIIVPGIRRDDDILFAGTLAEFLDATEATNG